VTNEKKDKRERERERERESEREREREKWQKCIFKINFFILIEPFWCE